MSDAIKGLVKFQTDRELDKKPYEALNEHTNIVAELLETLGLNVPKENRTKFGVEFAKFVANAKIEGLTTDIEDFEENKEHETVDGYCDVITFAVGALLKLGYDPEKSLQQCSQEINSRAGVMLNGKFEKDMSEEAQSLWLPANYTLALLDGK